MVSFAFLFALGVWLLQQQTALPDAILYDTGPDFSGEADSGKRILIPSLRAMGINKLDGLILSHDDIDHIGGTRSVIQSLPIEWVSSSLKNDHPLLGTVKRHSA
jgi:competence protein ComEC